MSQKADRWRGSTTHRCWASPAPPRCSSSPQVSPYLPPPPPQPCCSSSPQVNINIPQPEAGCAHTPTQRRLLPALSLRAPRRGDPYSARCPPATVHGPISAGVEISLGGGRKYLTKPCRASRLEAPPRLPPRATPVPGLRRAAARAAADGGAALPATSWLSLTLTEGKFRQVRTAGAGLVGRIGLQPAVHGGAAWTAWGCSLQCTLAEVS